MTDQYINHHYVPIWYQRRFLPAGQQEQELFRLDLRPGFFFDGRGRRQIYIKV
ncbi:MAG: hypothetical protein ABI672_20100 [Vicinamibacteria bacterium]